MVIGTMFEHSGSPSVVDIDHLALDGNEFRKGGYHRLANLLGQMTHIVTLSMKDCMLNDAGFCQIINELLSR